MYPVVYIAVLRAGKAGLGGLCRGGSVACGRRRHGPDGKTHLNNGMRWTPLLLTALCFRMTLNRAAAWTKGRKRNGTPDQGHARTADDRSPGRAPSRACAKAASGSRRPSSCLRCRPCRARRSAADERFEVTSIKAVRPTLTDTVAALEKRDVAAARAAFEAYDFRLERHRGLHQHPQQGDVRAPRAQSPSQDHQGARGRHARHDRRFSPTPRRCSPSTTIRSAS